MKGNELLRPRLHRLKNNSTWQPWRLLCDPVSARACIWWKFDLYNTAFEPQLTIRNLYISLLLNNLLP